jgi:hypothetical protein
MPNSSFSLFKSLWKKQYKIQSVMAWYAKSELNSDEYMHVKENQRECTCTCKVHNPPSATMYITLKHPSHAAVFHCLVKLY